MNIPKLLKQAEKLVSYGKVNEAISLYQEILSEDFQNTVVHGLIAELYVSKQEHQRASRHLFKVAADYSLQGDLTAAVQVYRKITRILPKNTLAREKMLEIFTRLGSKSEIFSIISELCTIYEAEGNSQKVIEYLQKLVSLDRVNKDHQLRLALFLSEKGIKDKAVEIFYEMAREFLREDRFDEALTTLEKIRALNSKERNIDLRIAEVFEKQGKVQKAIDVIGGALSQDPSRNEVLLYLARLCVKAGKLDEAEKAFDKLVRADKSYLAETLLFGEVLISEKKISRAISYLDSLLEELQDATARKKCAELLEEILKLDPQNLEAHRLLEGYYSASFQYDQLAITLLSHADAYIAKCDYAHALDLAKQLVDLEPYNEEYRKKFEFVEKLSSGGRRSIENPSKSHAPAPVHDEEEDEGYANAPVDARFNTQVSIVTDEDVENFIIDVELLEKFGQQVNAIRRLEHVLKSYPHEIKLRCKLKSLYVDRKMPKKAAQECLEIAKLLQRHDQKEEANKYIREAQRLNPVLSSAKQSSSEVVSAGPPTTSVAKEAYVALKGDLSEIGLLDVIQILENAQKTGKLLIVSDGQAGAIFLNSGRIVNATYQNKLGEAAMYALVAVKGGNFEYQPSASAFEVTINNSNTNLLLEGLRLLDEANRDQWEAELAPEEDAAPPSPSQPQTLPSVQANVEVSAELIASLPVTSLIDEKNPLEGI